MVGPQRAKSQAPEGLKVGAMCQSVHSVNDSVALSELTAHML